MRALVRWGVLGSLLCLLIIVTATPGQTRPSSQPVPRPAPEWDVAAWINAKELRLADLRGQVVVIEFFQLWCPGCNRFSIPLMQKWKHDFAPEIAGKKMKIVSIHTVFEGFAYQTPERLSRFVKRKSMDHPVGMDRHPKGSRLPETMRRYGTGGTPEVAIIDKKGVIRFQHLGGFEPRPAERLIRALLKE